MDPKPWYASKTILLNLATLLAVALALPDVLAIIPPSWLKYITALNAVLNVWLRLNGTESAALTLRKPPAAPLIALLITGSLAMAACASAPVDKPQTLHRLALVSESYAVALQRLQAWEIGQYQSHAISQADHVVWQRRIERFALAGKAANDAIRSASLSSVQAQARAILDVIDELIAEQVIRFTESQRMTATLILESMRTAVLVWSATMTVDRLGAPDTFDRMLEAA